MNELRRWQPPPVEPYDSPVRFLVKSLSRPSERHLVDLSSHHGNGECSCEDFQFNRLKRLKMGEPMSPRTVCRHIEAATYHFARKVAAHCTDPNSHLLAFLRHLD